jgi:hypothetical protein
LPQPERGSPDETNAPLCFAAAGPPPSPQNSAVVYGGAVLVQYGQYNATSTRHVNNTAEWGGGGAISLFSGVALLRSCELSGNRASFGGGLNAMRMKESTIAVPTIVSVNVSAAAADAVLLLQGRAGVGCWGGALASCVWLPASGYLDGNALTRKGLATALHQICHFIN